jgi:hypothetical protein
MATHDRWEGDGRGGSERAVQRTAIEPLAVDEAPLTLDSREDDEVARRQNRVVRFVGRWQCSLEQNWEVGRQ